MHDPVYPVLIFFGFHGSMNDAYPSAVYPPPPEVQAFTLSRCAQCSERQTTPLCVQSRYRCRPTTAVSCPGNYLDAHFRNRRAR